MKKMLLSLASLAIVAISANADESLLASAVFPDATTTEALLESNKTVGSFTLNATSSKAIGYDLNTAYFSENPSAVTNIDDCVRYTTRIKTKGAPDTKSPWGRYIYFNAPSAGVLKISARTGSGASERKMIVAQGSSTLLSQPLLDAQASSLPNPENPDSPYKIYPIYSVNIPSSGQVQIYGPDNGINFYEISFSTPNGFESQSIDAKGIVGKRCYNLLGTSVNEDTKGIVIVENIYEDGSKSVVKENRQ